MISDTVQVLRHRATLGQDRTLWGHHVQPIYSTGTRTEALGLSGAYSHKPQHRKVLLHSSFWTRS